MKEWEKLEGSIIGAKNKLVNKKNYAGRLRNKWIKVIEMIEERESARRKGLEWY